MKNLRNEKAFEINPRTVLSFWDLDTDYYDVDGKRIVFYVKPQLLGRELVHAGTNKGMVDNILLSKLKNVRMPFSKWYSLNSKIAEILKKYNFNFMIKRYEIEEEIRLLLNRVLL